MADENLGRMQSVPTGSSSSSRKFNLDDQDTRDILVYKMRTGYEIMSQQALCRELDKDPHWRCSRKHIARGTSRLNVQTRDLYNEPERTAYSKYPNSTSSIASVGLPRKVYWRRLLFGHFQNLYIVSPDSSPNSSPEYSQSSSNSNSPPDGPTPANTFNEPGEDRS